MEDKILTLYYKNKIIELVGSMLKNYDKSEYKKEIIKAAHLLMDKVRYCDEECITLEPDFIEEILFTSNDDETKSIVRDVYRLLRALDADLINVSFDNVHIYGYHFNGLKNVEIDIQKVPNCNLSHTSLEKVKINGTLDGANIEWADFTGYIGDLVLNPQLIQNKSLYFTNLNGLTVNGSFDGVKVRCMKTSGFKGEIIINPQKVIDKDLSQIDFCGVKIVGDLDKETGIYDIPCFDGCNLHMNNFKGYIGDILISLDKLKEGAYGCNFTGVKLDGKIKSDEIFRLKRSYFEDDNGEKIYLTHNKDYIEYPEDDKLDGEKIENHKSRIRKPNLINRIFCTCKK